MFKFSLVHKGSVLNSVHWRSKAYAAVGAGFALLMVQPVKAVDFQSSRTLSLSQSGRGGALLNDTIVLNPSLLGFQQAQALSGTFNWLNNAQTANGATSPRVYNASIVDGRNQYVSAGLSYTRRTDLDFIHVALAKRLFNPLSIGASLKRYSSNSNGEAAAGRSFSGFDGGVSMSVAIPENVLFGIPVQLGVTSDNLMHQKADEKFIGPRQIGTGLKFTLKGIVMGYADYVQNFSSTDGNYPLYSGGLELSLGGDFFARGGLFGFREKGWSFGGGWVGPRIGVSYGFQNKQVLAERSFNHAITMDLFM